MTWKDKKLRLSPRETRNFLHNAQLAACQLVADERIDTLRFYKNEVLSILTQELKISRKQLICVLTSAAYDLYQEETNGAKVSSIR